MIRVPSDAHSEDGLSGRDIARLRWIWLCALAAGCAMAILVFDADLPAGIVVAVLLVGMLVNALATRHASAVTLPLVLDVVLIGALLAASGGLGSPFAALLTAPAFVGTFSSDPRGAGRIAAVAVVVAGIVGFAGGAGAWPAVVAMAAIATLAGRRAEARRKAAGALARDAATDVDGIAFAAAAHEIASPLSTIRIAAAEMARTLEDRPEARADALLIEREALRCGAILEAARGSRGSRESNPISEILELAAEPHRDRGVHIDLLARGAGPEPRVGHARDVTVGLRNIIQNAVEFASSEVTVEASWTAEGIEVTIRDDGDGFDGAILEGARPEPGRPRARGGPGTGRGVGLARALLARSGGEIELGNAPSGGARVRVAWARTAEHG